MSKRVAELQAYTCTCMKLSTTEAESIARKEAVAAVAWRVREGKATFEDLRDAELLFGVVNPLKDY